MPLSRTALYAQGEDLHIAVWPGSASQHPRHHRYHRALESRSYVASVSGLMRRGDIGGNAAWRDAVTAAATEMLADGGSCIAGPDGEWVIPPAGPEEDAGWLHRSIIGAFSKSVRTSTPADTMRVPM